MMLSVCLVMLQVSNHACIGMHSLSSNMHKTKEGCRELQQSTADNDPQSAWPVRPGSKQTGGLLLMCCSSWPSPHMPCDDIL